MNANSYNITAKDTAGATVTANSSDTGNGGGSTVGAYQINTGTNFYVDSTGWGVGGWGALRLASLWRLPRQISCGCIVRTHLAMTLYSTPEVVLFTSGMRAVAYQPERWLCLAWGGASDTPVEALQVMVSDIDRHVICLVAIQLVHPP